MARLTNSAGDPALNGRRISLRSRVALLVAGAVGTTILLGAVGSYVAVRHELLRNLDETLQNRAVAAKAAVQTAAANSRLIGVVSPGVIGASDVKIALINANGQGRVITVAAPPMGEEEFAVAFGTTRSELRTAVDAYGARYRQVTLPISPGIALVVAQSLAPTDATLKALGLVMWITGAVGMVLAAGAGYAVARSGLRPVAELTRAAERVAATDRLEPIPVTGSDEIARLTRSYNAMLAALGRSRDRQRQLVGDAGHELRTPLTSIRTNLDLLAQAESAPAGGQRLSHADRAQLFDDIRAEMQEFTTLLNDLTELSRETPQHLNRQELDLAELVEDSVARVRRRAPKVTFRMDLAAHRVRGNDQLLVRAITNLVDNAAKYTPDGGTVTVTLLAGELIVTDTGRGIGAADLPHVFERFYRSAEARGRAGSGLGLAIVRHVADQHGGTVSAGNAPGAGARFVLRIPGSGTGWGNSSAAAT